MTTIRLIDERGASPEVAEIFADIRATLHMPYVPALFRAIAHNPAYLRVSWERVKVVMGPGLIDRKTKEMIATAVSAVNGCDYCAMPTARHCVPWEAARRNWWNSCRWSICSAASTRCSKACRLSPTSACDLICDDQRPPWSPGMSEPGRSFFTRSARG